ncbi:MAG: thioredoxin fold domain-containing protein [Butyrivibrio sp.]|nr:thioredoxin fold domain-containing protein [Butyrivibrio sp.]
MISYANYENFNELFAEGFTIVDFYSVTCGPCKLFSKILEEITYDLPFVNIVKVNLTDFPKIGEQYEIDAVPTIFFVKDGEIRERVVGVMEQEEVMEKISQYYYE